MLPTVSDIGRRGWDSKELCVKRFISWRMRGRIAAWWHGSYRRVNAYHAGSAGLPAGWEGQWGWEEREIFVAIALLSFARGRSIRGSIIQRRSDALVAGA